MMNQRATEIINCGEPLYFCHNYAKLRQFDSPDPGDFTITEFAENLINSVHQNKFTVALADRQTGKTSAAVEYALWYALFNPYTTIVLYGHSLSSAKELLDKLRYSFNQLPNWLRLPLVTDNKTEISLENGAHIFAMSNPAHLRGRNINLMIVDEAAYVRNFGDLVKYWYPVSASSPNCKILMVTTRNPQGFEFEKFLISERGRYYLVTG